MNEPDNLHDLYELYALGLLEEPELSQVEQQLKSGDPAAKQRLRQALENNAMMLATVQLVEPPKKLRRRVMGSVGVVERNWGFLGAWAAATAALLIGGVYFGAQSQRVSSELAQVKSEMQNMLQQSARTNAELAQARQVLSFLNEPETRMVTFGPKDPKPPKGRVLVHATRGVLLMASNLPQAPSGKIYELWIIPKGGANPIPSGLFQSDESGNAIFLRQGAIAPGSKVAVTLEPAAGSPSPTSDILIVAGV